ncbi:MAG: S-adenosylmethionine decarboxylase [bacterium]
MNNSQLILDCFGCPKEKLADMATVFTALDKMPAKLGMDSKAEPKVFSYSGEGIENDGVSGVIMVNESHISIHTFPDKGQAFVSIFSRQEFDPEAAKQELIRLFEAKKHEVITQSRKESLDSFSSRIIH